MSLTQIIAGYSPASPRAVLSLKEVCALFLSEPQSVVIEHEHGTASLNEEAFAAFDAAIAAREAASYPDNLREKIAHAEAELNSLYQHHVVLPVQQAFSGRAKG